MRVREFAPLRALNTFRVAAHARWLIEVADPAELSAVLGHPEWRDLPLLVLGAGSNTLFTRDWDGVVLRVVGRRIHESLQRGEEALVRVEAGRDWHDFVRWTLAHGYAGLENLALIPGTVGAAPIQNIGAYGAELAPHVDAVEAYDRSAGRPVVLDREACAFGYRDSLFKQSEARERYIITAVRFRLTAHAPLTLDYPGLRETLAAMGVTQPRARDVAAAVEALRRRKLPDPAAIGNAGSFFKNPVVPAAAAEALRAAHPELPVYPAGPGTRKLAAAWLIEAAGWKGRRIGDAGVSARHALVLVNHGEASGAELLALARRIQADVVARFGVALEPEPRIV